MKLTEGGYAPQSRSNREPMTPPPKAPRIPRPNKESLEQRKDKIFTALLASRVYTDAKTHELGMERVFEMFNKYFEEN